MPTPRRSSPKTSLKRVMDSKTVREKVFMIVTQTSEETYKALSLEAKRRGLTIDNLISEIVKVHLGEKT